MLYIKVKLFAHDEFIEKCLYKHFAGTSLVVQWLRIQLPMQVTRVQALVWKIPHAAEQLSPCATITEPAL